MTSTAALQAAIEVSGSQDPAVGYSVAYPIGVIGPILCMYLFQALLRPKVEAPGLQGLPLCRDRHPQPRGGGPHAGGAGDPAARGRHGHRRPPAAPQPGAARRARPARGRRAPCRGRDPGPRWRPPAACWASWCPCAWPRTAPTSTTCGSSSPGRAWSGSSSRPSRCRAAPATRWSISAAATPSSCRAPT